MIVARRVLSLHPSERMIAIEDSAETGSRVYEGGVERGMTLRVECLSMLSVIDVVVVECCAPCCNRHRPARCRQARGQGGESGIKFHLVTRLNVDGMPISPKRWARE